MSTKRLIDEAISEVEVSRNSLSGMRGMSTEIPELYEKFRPASQFPVGNEGYVNRTSKFSFKNV